MYGNLKNNIMNKIKIIIPYTKSGLNGKDFEIFIKGLNLLKYPVEFYVIGNFLEEYMEKYKFIEDWIKCEEENIQNEIKNLKL